MGLIDKVNVNAAVFSDIDALRIGVVVRNEGKKSWRL